MPSVKYGSKIINYTILEKTGLQSHYISVHGEEGVTLKGKSITIEKSQQLILKKAAWILDKLELVKPNKVEAIVTGSRLQYLGRRYYVSIILQNQGKEIIVDFTASQFKIHVPIQLHNQVSIKAAFDKFIAIKAVEKITPRVQKLSQQTGLQYRELKFRKLEKRWGSCTPANNIILNVDAVKLPYKLIDYVIVHELVHTKVKSHSKEFWIEVNKHLSGWKELDREIMLKRITT